MSDAATTTAEVRAIAKEAYIYGEPMWDGYPIQHADYVDSGNPEYNGPLNRIHNMARVSKHLLKSLVGASVLALCASGAHAAAISTGAPTGPARGADTASSFEVAQASTLPAPRPPSGARPPSGTRPPSSGQPPRPPGSSGGGQHPPHYKPPHYKPPYHPPAYRPPHHHHYYRHHHHYGAALAGLAIGAIVHTAPPTSCVALTINGLSYLRCDRTWLQVQPGPTITYVVVPPFY